MRTFAPGKLVLTGAYVVLEGAPAIAVAVNRGAFADSCRIAKSCTPEVRAALGGRPASEAPDDEVSAPDVDAAEMFVDGRKLGLGASAAILVASLAARAAARGADLAARDVREQLFANAREAHALVQSGGSGVDVATSVYGGTIEYRIGAPPKVVSLPTGLRLTVYACQKSARTSELRADVARLAERQPALYRTCMDDLGEIARAAASAVGLDDAAAFLDALRRSARALARLGEAAGVEIVPAGFDELEAIATSDGGSFSVSGAGGGDVAVYIGPGPASAQFDTRAKQLGLFSIDLSLDYKGVRIAPLAAHAANEALFDRP